MRPLDAPPLAVMTSGALSDAVAFLTRAVPSGRSSTPELGGVSITTAGEEVTLRTTDLDVTAMARVPGEVPGDAGVVVSARLFAALVATLPRGQQVSLSLVNGRLGITCAGSAWLLPVMPADLYPPLPDLPPCLAEVDGAELSAALAQVLPAAGTDPVLPAFYGIQLEIEGDLLHLVASDRYRLAMAEVLVTPAGPNVEWSGLVPLGIAQSLTQGAGAGAVRIHAGAGLLALAGAHATVYGRRSSAPFPAWRAFVGIPGAEWAAVDRKALERAVRQVSVLGTYLVDLEATESYLTATAAEDDSTAAVPSTLVGDPWRARVRPRYLLDALAAVGTEWVSIEQGPNRVVLVPADKAGTRLSGYRHTVMQLSGVAR